jgi:large subunit ribosomal protein L19
MTTALQGVNISPVNMEDRAKLAIRAGDTVRVHQKIQDKGKTRIQIFEGLVLSRKHGDEPGAMFTVRKVVDGIGVEKIFPLYSPLIDKIEILRRSKVRRAKLYYIREKVAREIKRQMRRMHIMGTATESDIEAANRAEADAKVAEEEKTRLATEEVDADATAQEAEVVETPEASESPAENSEPEELKEEDSDKKE